VTSLLHDIRSGDPDAANKLVPIVIRELHGLAQHYLNAERPGHTLQPTALVNEAYLRLVGDQARDWQNRAHFIGVTASIMRRILIDYARRKKALKRVGGEQDFRWQENPDALSSQEAEELIALDTALDALETMNPRQRQVVELRYFGGLSIEEAAEAMNVSPITVKRDWVAARAWLKRQVRPAAMR
jgi:RNA polymerase sigma factor (TIGR02999 family)